MIQAIGKRYQCIGDNIYEEHAQGACLGAEWIDDNGNTLRMLWAFTPTFNPSAKYAEMLYKVFIKPVGRDNFILDSEIVDHLGTDKYFYSDINTNVFGKREPDPFDEGGELKPGLITQVQFFVDNFVVNVHGIPMSFKMFIYPFIMSTQNVNIQ
jgi:hypothetical protein